MNPKDYDPTHLHLRAWYTSSVYLDGHLIHNHQLQPSSNRKDWATQHAVSHWAHTDKEDAHTYHH